jgi:hypothetical protein
MKAPNAIIRMGLPVMPQPPPRQVIHLKTR